MKILRLFAVAAVIASSGCAASKPDPENPAHCLAAFNFTLEMAKGLPIEQHDKGMKTLREGAAFEIYKLKAEGRLEKGKLESTAFAQRMKSSPDQFYILAAKCVPSALTDPTHKDFEREHPEIGNGS